MKTIIAILATLITCLILVLIDKYLIHVHPFLVGWLCSSAFFLIFFYENKIERP